MGHQVIEMGNGFYKQSIVQRNGCPLLYYYLNIKFRYNNDRLSLNYDNKQERDRDYKKICNEWKNNTDKYGD